MPLRAMPRQAPNPNQLRLPFEKSLVELYNELILSELRYDLGPVTYGQLTRSESPFFRAFRPGRLHAAAERLRSDINAVSGFADIGDDSVRSRQS